MVLRIQILPLSYMIKFFTTSLTAVPVVRSNMISKLHLHSLLHSLGSFFSRLYETFCGKLVIRKIIENQGHLLVRILGEDFFGK